MALNIIVIAHNISDLDVNEVHIRDLTAIPEKVTDRDCPILYPLPNGFVTNLTVQIDSFGDARAKKTVFYTLTYRFLEASLGSGRGLFDLYSDFVKHVFAVLDKLIDSQALSGQIDLEIESISNFGPVADPSGNMFHGCDIALRIMEFVN